jgi:hypothetical protein
MLCVLDAKATVARSILSLDLLEYVELTVDRAIANCVNDHLKSSPISA